MAAASKRVKRGFILGKFMPPHAGHVTLIQSARALVDELTILLCSLPDDPILGETRLLCGGFRGKRWQRWTTHDAGSFGASNEAIVL